MNNVFKVPESLASKYHGSGYAIAAVVNRQLIDIVYFGDILPDFDPNNIQAAVTDSRIGESVRYLQSLGDVHVGMMSCWEFVEL